MAFSGALTLTDLNDYLGPSQACIKPVEGADAPSSSEATSPEAAASASTQIAIDHDGSYYESAAPSTSTASKPRLRTKLETAEISLNDCLACSGCVTSAESVLITMQSQEEMRRAIAEIAQSDSPSLRVASISTQSLASLSAKYSFQQQSASAALPLRVLLHRIAHFLQTTFGFDHVYDTTFARHIALKEHQREFFQRREDATLPMLASACPGWICYAEKTHGELLPYISTTKSPQQVAGVIAKRFLPQRLGLLASATTYHVTVMPCYDKKLEASRPDFYDDITSTKEVDCVLTTGELDKLMLDENFDICAPVPGEHEALQHDIADSSLQQALPASMLPHIPQLLDQPGSSSGGYLFALMRAVWLDWLAQHWHRFPASVREQGLLPKLDVRVIRTVDFTEYVLRAPAQLEQDAASSHSSILFRGAQCYGFRNLQNLVRKLQKQTGARNSRGAAGRLVDAHGNAVGAARTRARGRGGMVRRGRGGAAVNKSSPLNPDSALSTAQQEDERGYDYVEVMACPSGCVNGGGQIRPPTETASSSKDPEGFTQGWAAADQNADDGDALEHMLNNKTCSKRATLTEDDEAEMDADGPREKEIAGWKGTSKEWVHRVEQAYWHGARVAHVPVTVAACAPSDSGASTPTLVASGANTPLSSTNAKSIRVEDHQRLLEALALQKDTMAYADVLAELVVTELCQAAAADAGVDGARDRLFRTQYRAVQDEAVNGLAVQW
ncbi:related to NAR1-similarity to human nuclear prelamin A recognition factor [Sporisorium reilianum f. sp. reilianum]|uniref:Cytosolic Fe-S cluster assembly factor NAR1 n=1 Tax=Sporisorium reilianum f. sp. reilianum TaxID=72559 RepID=A0A2N8UE71_9BASI|nr:related to NAR1-similarity to human nuclear prelamin A recognition factor [Sporisorium reilianum f. sp. reilianum]